MAKPFKGRSRQREPLLYRLADLPALLSVSPRAADEWIADGKIASVKLGTGRFVTADELRRVVAEGIG